MLKNPFNSIHAVALTNLGELTSGLVMLENLKSNNKKGIVTKIECEYYKKARGKITAYSYYNKKNNNIIKTEIFNKNNELVCKISCSWDIKDK